MNLNRLYLGLLYQDEMWRDQNGNWLKIADMSENHLINARVYLLNFSYDYMHLDAHPRESLRDLTGEPSFVPNAQSRRWMTNTRLYVALGRELSSRGEVYISSPGQYSGAELYARFRADSEDAIIHEVKLQLRRGLLPITISKQHPAAPGFGQAGRPRVSRR